MLRTIVTILASLMTMYLAICILLYVVQERFIFFPEVLPPQYRFTFPDAFNEVTIPVNGATLHALHFTVPQPRGVVMYLHGNAGSVRSWGSVASDFTSRGYAVLIPDYRGYGKSTGSIFSERMLHQDAAAIYAYLQQQYPEEQMIVYGRSIGTGLAVHLAHTHRPKLLILETPYFNLQELATAQFPWVPPFLFKYPLRIDQWISDVACPIMLVHGTRDTVIPFDASLRLLPRIRSEHRLATIDDGGHNNLGTFPQYDAFLSEVLR
jgi:alpha-beta hydrolase superfamily lysophospholipase